MIYRSYLHAKSATVISVICAVISSFMFLAALILSIIMLLLKIIPDKLSFLERFDIDIDIAPDKKWFIALVLLIACGVIFYIIANKVTKKLAKLIIRRKIRKSTRFAYKYVLEDPYNYKYAASLNREFAEKYKLDRYYNLVERRKRR